MGCKTSWGFMRALISIAATFVCLAGNPALAGDKVVETTLHPPSAAAIIRKVHWTLDINDKSNNVLDFSDRITIESAPDGYYVTHKRLSINGAGIEEQASYIMAHDFPVTFHAGPSLQIIGLKDEADYIARQAADSGLSVEKGPESFFYPDGDANLNMQRFSDNLSFMINNRMISVIKGLEIDDNMSEFEFYSMPVHLSYQVVTINEAAQKARIHVIWSATADAVRTAHLAALSRKYIYLSKLLNESELQRNKTLAILINDESDLLKSYTQSFSQTCTYDLDIVSGLALTADCRRDVTLLVSRITMKWQIVQKWDD